MAATLTQKKRVYAILVGVALAGVFLLALAPAPLRHVFVGTGRVLVRVRGASIAIQGRQQPVLVFRTVVGPTEYAFYSPSTTPLRFQVLLFRPSDLALSYPNAGTTNQYNAFGWLLLQSRTGSLGASPGKAGWAPEAEVVQGRLFFHVPPEAGAASTVAPKAVVTGLQL